MQQRQINAMRAEVERLEMRQRVPIAKADSAVSSSMISAEDIERLREENRDIHKLRGQISQAREKRRAFEKMQAENAQLRKRIADVKVNPDAANTDPFPLSNKGQSTPEATVETMFWSMYKGDMESLSRIMPMMTREFEKMPAEERTNNVMLLRATASTIQGLEILDRRIPSADEAQLDVRVKEREDPNKVPGWGQQTFTLRRSNNVWQIVSPR
jgi:hypothetical protein